MRIVRAFLRAWQRRRWTDSFDLITESLQNGQFALVAKQNDKKKRQQKKTRKGSRRTTKNGKKKDKSKKKNKKQ